MRRIFLFFIFLLTACSPSVRGQPAPPTTLAPAITATLVIPTLTATLAPSATPFPTETPAPPTVTPLPTIPTFTPTFDARTIVTATLAPKAVCPKEDPSLKAEFYVPVVPACVNAGTCLWGGTEQEILEFLNKGGAIQSAAARLRSAVKGNYQGYKVQDVTNDGIPDLLFIDFGILGRLHIFFCENGSYNLFSTPKGDYRWGVPIGIIVEDLNLDKIPEIIFRQGEGNFCCHIHILELNRSTFDDLTQNIWTRSLDTPIQDIDGDKTKEIIATGLETHTELV